MRTTYNRRTLVWRLLAAVGFGAILCMTPQSAMAQNVDLNDLQTRVERLEKENQELRQAQASPAYGSQAPSNAATAGAQPNQDPPQEGYRIGSLTTVTAAFRDGTLWFTTPNADFTMHPGFWMQLDNVFWNESTALNFAQGGRPTPAKQGIASGENLGGMNNSPGGDLQDGEYFRRIRPFVEGTFWETGEYRLILALENNQFSTSGLDEFWVGDTQLPVVGSVRVGHVKTPMGLEGDMTASSRCMTFMERSSYSEAIELNQNFVTGIWFNNTYLDQRVAWETAAFRTDQKAASGVFFGDGQYGLQGRLTGLPLYECDGRQLLHVGLSGGWRTGSNNLATSPDRTFDLSARPELRDDDPAAGGPTVIPNANSLKMIDTGAIAASDEYLMGLELLYIRGPLSLQAEYGWNWINNAYAISPGTAAAVKLTAPQDYTFTGGYVQLAYTLTGENRAYDKRLGTLARNYYGTSGPYTNGWLVRDEDGHLSWGLGAWEIAARYSHVDLNDGSGLNRIQGGEMDGFTLALNWYVNANLNVMLDWVFDNRYDLPKGATPATSTAEGFTSGFGAEVQLQF